MTLPDPIPSIPLQRQLSGLHILANLQSEDLNALCDVESIREFLNNKITDLGLTKVGEVYHGFDGGGFTCVVCLTESHLSIHTWPEFNYITLDVFLSNFQRDNSDTTRKLYEHLKTYFKATVVFENFVNR